MLGFKRFDAAVFNYSTKQAELKSIWSFCGFFINPRWWTKGYALLCFHGKESLQDAKYAVAKFKEKSQPQALTKEHLTKDEVNSGNVEQKLDSAHDIVAHALAKTTDEVSVLNIELKL